MPPSENPVPAADYSVQVLTLPITAAEIRYNTVRPGKYLKLTFTGGVTVNVPVTN
jgi:hypothetical protein